MNNAGKNRDEPGVAAPMPAWPWTLAYAVLALPFAPFWMDFETARRGLGVVLGGVALLALLAPRRDATTLGMPRRTLAAGLAVVAIHLLSCALAPNLGDALLRTAWLASLLAIAALAARHTEPLTQLRAIAPIGALVAGFGLAQAAGFEWPSGYSMAGDPVSTLGNRNVAAELTAIAAVAAALVALRAPRPWFGLGTVTLGVAYLWVNHSRGGLLAAGLTLVPLALVPTRRHPAVHRLGLGLALLLGLAGGQGLRWQTPQQPESTLVVVPAAPTRHAPDEPPPPSTIDVRLELWRAGLRMLASAPLLGVGAGQFKLEYPRFRSPAEIELSTRGRQFAATPMSAHCDALELGIETGGLGLAVAVLFWVLAVWPARRSALVAPAVAFVVLGLVRSPLGNAPAAAMAFAVVGALCRREFSAATATGRPLRLALGALAAVTVGSGVRELAGQCAAVPHVAAQRTPPEQRQWLVQMHALDRAVAWCPWDASLRAAQARLRFRLATENDDRTTLAGLLRPDGAVAQLLRIAPHSTGNQVFAAEVAARAGDHADAARRLEAVLRQDPPNPEARLFLATEQVVRGDVRTAVATLYADGAPHPQLRRDLARHLAELQAATDDSTLRQVLAQESAFLAALDALGRAPDADATVRQIQQFAGLARRDDLRAVALLALGMLRSSDPQVRGEANNAAQLAPSNATMTEVHARLFGRLLDPLRTAPGWRARLPGP